VSRAYTPECFRFACLRETAPAKAEHAGGNGNCYLKILIKANTHEPPIRITLF
jgi:hypothetical protein